MTQTISLKHKLEVDRLLWIFFLTFLAIIAFFLLARESKKQYGSVAYGVFPEFAATDSGSSAVDHHRLHGQLSVVILAANPIDPDVSLYLHKLSRATAHGRKFLKTLVLTNQEPGISDQTFEYWRLSDDQFKNLVNWAQARFKSSIILVDQNRVVRGVFDLHEKVQRLNFEAAVGGIL